MEAGVFAEEDQEDEPYVGSGVDASATKKCSFRFPAAVLAFWFLSIRPSVTGDVYIPQSLGQIQHDCHNGHGRKPSNSGVRTSFISILIISLSDHAPSISNHLTPLNLQTVTKLRRQRPYRQQHSAHSLCYRPRSRASSFNRRRIDERLLASGVFSWCSSTLVFGFRMVHCCILPFALTLPAPVVPCVSFCVSFRCY